MRRRRSSCRGALGSHGETLASSRDARQEEGRRRSSCREALASPRDARQEVWRRGSSCREALASPRDTLQEVWRRGSSCREALASPRDTLQEVWRRRTSCREALASSRDARQEVRRRGSSCRDALASPRDTLQEERRRGSSCSASLASCGEALVVLTDARQEEGRRRTSCRGEERRERAPLPFRGVPLGARTASPNEQRDDLAPVLDARFHHGAATEEVMERRREARDLHVGADGRVDLRPRALCVPVLPRVGRAGAFDCTRRTAPTEAEECGELTDGSPRAWTPYKQRSNPEPDPGRGARRLGRRLDRSMLDLHRSTGSRTVR